ncbi:unnamed protein product [Owenia fusiformis]|uniref:Uncharacterized protein n=1 Tax=Owenia fusiformis TaxID=6347 RepID=A0A8J1U0Y9_OWEFU|nr:unnamed protein product [Owenia fusiformis]
MVSRSKNHILIINIIVLVSTVGILIQSGYTEYIPKLISIQMRYPDPVIPQPKRYLKQDSQQVPGDIQTKVINSDELISNDELRVIKNGKEPMTTIQNNMKLTTLKPSSTNGSLETKAETIPFKEIPTQLPPSTMIRNNEITQARKVDSDKYIVFLCGEGKLCGGLGDRLKGIQSTFLLALVLKRKFRIISTVPCDLYNQLGENNEPWHRPITPGLKNKTIRMIDKYKACGDLIFQKTNVTMMNIDAKFPEPVIKIRTNQGWTHRFHEEPYKTILTNLGLDMSNFTAKYIFSKIYNHLFKPQRDVLTLLDRFLNRARPKLGIKLVCAQIRIGYNPSIPRESSRKRRNHDKWLPVLWDFLSLYNDSSKYTIFITTDSQEIRDHSKKLFPDTIIDTDGEITHVDRFDNKDDACKGMEKTILDFTILANCDITVVSRSNFGKLSSQLQSPASKLYTFEEGVIHEGPECSPVGKAFNRTTKLFTDDCSQINCPPSRSTKCAE